MTTAIDLFAGAGGFTTAAQAAGVRVTWAANHWQAAVEIHRQNHPGTQHVCQDLQQADWRKVPAHDVLLASPACQGHTPARGKERPHYDTTRSTAWAVIACAEYHRPQLAVIENVPEFLDWDLYPSWSDAMARLGYALAPHIVDAADHGVPQHRRRLFLIASRSSLPLQLDLPKQAHRPIAPVIRWDRHRWSEIEKPGRSPQTLARIKAGRARFGRRFVAPYYSSGSGKTGRSIDRPLGTVTTRDRWAVVDGDRMRMLQPDEYLDAMGFPDGYHLPANRKQAIHMLGNAVCPPVGRDVIKAALAALRNRQGLIVFGEKTPTMARSARAIQISMAGPARDDEIMTPDELQTAGEKLFGPRWQTALARALGVDGSTVRRWLSERLKITTQVSRHIDLLVRLKAAGQLEEYLDNLKR